MISRAATSLLHRAGPTAKQSFLRASSTVLNVPSTAAAAAAAAAASPSSSGGSYPKSSSSRFFSSDSHDDFAPKRKEVDGQDEALKLIQDHVDSNPVMLYMKGNPSMPMCGFSARVVQVLQSEGVDFASVNVLDYPDIREAVKKFSEWPTIPQLYVDGEFIGGCDIITQMHESGELKKVLEDAKAVEG